MLLAAGTNFVPAANNMHCLCGTCFMPQYSIRFLLMLGQVRNVLPANDEVSTKLLSCVLRKATNFHVMHRTSGSDCDTYQYFLLPQ